MTVSLDRFRAAGGAINKASLSLFVVGAAFTAQTSGQEADRAQMAARQEQALAPGVMESASAADQSDAASGKENPLEAIPLRVLSETRDRPIFSPSRRPPAPVIVDTPAQPTTPVAATEHQLPPLALIGTIVGVERRIAILRNQTTNEVTQASEGQQEPGWRVREVSPRSAVVEVDGHSITLELPRPDSRPDADGAHGDAAQPAHVRTPRKTTRAHAPRA
jgi:general secretion pathway protein N